MAGTLRPPSRTSGALASTAAPLLEELLAPLAPRAFGIRLWDGSEIGGRADGEPSVTLVIRRPEGLRALLTSRDAVGIGGAFVRGEVDVEGSLDAAIGVADDLLRLAPPPSLKVRLAALAWRLPRPPDESAAIAGAGEKHSRARDDVAIRHHYDLDPAFYAAFLDRRMVYSCAYFERPDVTLDEAQEAKLDLVCRKLRLAPGMRLVDVGCGWGALVRFAAERYGAIAHGITLSRAQADAARAMLREAGLGEDRARVDRLDYRDLPAAPAYDRAVSIGMVEHVGEDHLRTYMEAAFRCLVPGGLFLNHGIAGFAGRAETDQGHFIDRYVFPDSECPPIGRIVDAAEKAGFEVLDVESLRPHYAATLRCWIANLERNRERAVAAAGEEAYRVWRLYMTGCARRFEAAGMTVHQELLSRCRADGTHDAPPTREDVYRPGAEPPA